MDENQLKVYERGKNLKMETLSMMHIEIRGGLATKDPEDGEDDEPATVIRIKAKPQQPPTPMTLTPIDPKTKTTWQDRDATVYDILKELKTRPAVVRQMGKKPFNMEVPIGYVDVLLIKMKDDAADDTLIRDLEGCGKNKTVRFPTPTPTLSLTLTLTLNPITNLPTTQILTPTRTPALTPASTLTPTPTSAPAPRPHPNHQHTPQPTPHMHINQAITQKTPTAAKTDP